MSKTILVIAPHPDDEVLGCGGVMARHKHMGDRVYVLVVTRGSPELFPPETVQWLHEEMHRAHDVLGVEETRVLDFPAPKLDMIAGYEIADALHRVIQEWQPDTVYIPHRGDIHADHMKIHMAALVAARPVANCPVNKILSYETLSETDWAPPTGENAFIPTIFTNISDFLDRKLEAMQCYVSQIRSLPSTRSLESLQALARLRGGTINVNAAEAFMLIRDIER